MWGPHDGHLAYTGAVDILRRNMGASRAALGPEVTRTFFEQRRSSRSKFNGEPIEDQIRALASGQGKTYFDIVMEIFADHPELRLQPA